MNCVEPQTHLLFPNANIDRENFETELCSLLVHFFNILESPYACMSRSDLVEMREHKLSGVQCYASWLQKLCCVDKESL